MISPTGGLKGERRDKCQRMCRPASIDPKDKAETKTHSAKRQAQLLSREQSDLRTAVPVKTTHLLLCLQVRGIFLSQAHFVLRTYLCNAVDGRLELSCAVYRTKNVCEGVRRYWWQSFCIFNPSWSPASEAFAICVRSYEHRLCHCSMSGTLLSQDEVRSTSQAGRG